MLNGKSILVTGGTGSFGKKFIKTILEDYPEIERIVVFSRDELKQFEMSQEFPPKSIDKFVILSVMSVTRTGWSGLSKGLILSFMLRLLNRFRPLNTTPLNA